MKVFTIYNSLGQKTKLEIDNIQLTSIDCAKMDAKYLGMELKNRSVCFGGGFNKPFLRFWQENEAIYAVFTQEIIEYIWEQIGSPYTGLLYSYTKNYRANWCD